MPSNNQQVGFYFGIQQEYDDLEIKNSNAIYFITDTKKIYVGDKIYAAPIPENIAFLTQEQKQKLDNIAVVGSIEPNLNNNGIMLYDDKLKLDRIQESAEVNQNAFSKIKANNTTILANSKEDTLELIAGNNITLIPGNLNYNKTITISATDTTYNVVTQNADGLMSMNDKIKLDNLPNISFLTQTQYDNLSSVDNNTLYIIIAGSENE